MSSIPPIVEQHAPIVRLHSKEVDPPVHPDDWLREAKLYWYDGGQGDPVCADSALELFESGAAGDFVHQGQRLMDVTRPWDGKRPKPGGTGFVVTPNRAREPVLTRPDRPVPVFYEHVEDRYVTYWLWYPWSTVPRKIPSRDAFEAAEESVETGEETTSADAADPATVAEADAALSQTYPELVQAAVSEYGAEEGVSPRDLLRFVRAWLGPKWPVLHEGDWEGVAVELATGRRQRAAYFQHGAPQVRELPDDGRPVVYVALGSHASYPDTSASSEGSPLVKRFESLGEGDLVEIELFDVRSKPWFGYGGAWGAGGPMSDETGPLGPGEHKGPRPFAGP